MSIEETILRRRAMELTLPTLVDLFLATKQTEGKTAKTLGWYRQKLEKFIDFMEPGATLDDVDLNAARAFVAHLQGKESIFTDHPYRPVENHPLSKYTIQGYVRTLKSFSSFLAEENFTKENRLAKLKIPEAPEAVIEILSDEEIERLLDEPNQLCPLGNRLYTIVILLLDTGLRASELCGLTIDNVHASDNYLKVMGKGQKERLVPFGNQTKKDLIKWLTIWREELAAQDCQFVFVNNDGYQLTYEALQQTIKRLGKRTGIPRLRPHLFRHTFAVRYLMAGGDLMTLKLILGHTTLAVTQMYLHLAQSHVQVQHSKFSPVDHLRGRRK